MSRFPRVGSALGIFASVLAVVVALGTLIVLWGPRSERFVDLAKTGSESTPVAFHSVVYGLPSYMSRSEEFYGDTADRVVSHTTFSALAICANAVATLALAALVLTLMRRTLSFAILARPCVIALQFAGIGFLVPVTLLIIYYSTATGWWPSSSWFVWPTAFLLVTTHGIVNRFWWEIVAVSIATNVAIYAGVGLAVSLAIKHFASPSNNRWRGP
jgi:hypothetical protein